MDVLLCKAAIKTLQDAYLAADEKNKFAELCIVKQALLENNTENVFVRNIVSLLFIGLNSDNIHTNFTKNKELVLALLENAYAKMKSHLHEKAKGTVFIPVVKRDHIQIPAKINTISSDIKTNKIKRFPESAAHIAISRSDLVVLPASLITQQGKIFSPVGAGIYESAAKEAGVPVYCVSSSLHYSEDPYIENIFINAKAEYNVDIPKYEVVKEITGIITESGIYSKQGFIQVTKKAYVDLLNKLS